MKMSVQISLSREAAPINTLSGANMQNLELYIVLYQLGSTLEKNIQDRFRKRIIKRFACENIGLLNSNIILNPERLEPKIIAYLVVDIVHGK